MSAKSDRGCMNRTLFLLLFSVLSAVYASSQAAETATAPVSGTCSLKPDQLDALLALPFLKFDQDQSGGWRELQYKGCVLEAAMTIDAYLVDAPEQMKTVTREDLYFHAGQLYAWSGLKKLAARRFLRSFNLHETGDEELAWNPYVLATVAFLQGDREEFDHQRKLLSLGKSTPENKINLGVVDG